MDGGRRVPALHAAQRGGPQRGDRDRLYVACGRSAFFQAVGQAREVLEKRPAGHAGDGGDRGRRWLDIAGLDQVQGGLNERLPRAQAPHDAPVLRT